MAFGGLIFNTLPALRNRIPGHFLGERLADAPEAVERLLRVPILPAPAAPPAKAYLTTLAAYQDHQASIEAELWQKLKPADLAHFHLGEINNNLADNIKAALTLGDIGFLGSTITWVEGLLVNYHIPLHALQGYLEAYYSAARLHLGQNNLITLWLKQVISTGE